MHVITASIARISPQAGIKKRSTDLAWDTEHPSVRQYNMTIKRPTHARKKQAHKIANYTIIKCYMYLTLYLFFTLSFTFYSWIMRTFYNRSIFLGNRFRFQIVICTWYSKQLNCHFSYVFFMLVEYLVRSNSRTFSCNMSICMVAVRRWYTYHGTAPF